VDRGCGISLHQFRGDKVVLERIYVTERFDAAEWRSEWAEMFDPLESFTPEEQTQSAPAN
jgi:hypothetical protein